MNLQCLIILLLCGWSFSADIVPQPNDRRCIDPIETCSLTFVVDVSGSMGDDLVQLKQTFHNLIDTVTANFPCGYRKYIMVPFNDPDIGPVYFTSSRNDFEGHFQTLMASGGGDCPELAMGGIKLALESSPPYAVIVVLTDATAKDHGDAALISDIQSLIATKNCQVIFWLTGQCNGFNDPAYLIYDKIARWSNGHVLNIQLSEMSLASKYLELPLSRSISKATQLFSGNYKGGENIDKFTIADDYIIIIIIIIRSSDRISVIGPEGSPAKINPVASGTWGSLYEVHKPPTGPWAIASSGTEPYTITIEGRQDIKA